MDKIYIPNKKFMNIFKLVFTISFFISSISLAQNVGRWRAGSGNKLEGKVYTLSCFISGPDDEWSYDEKTEVLKKLDEAHQWLVSQAAKSGVALAFEGGNFGLKKDIKLEQIERGTASGNEKTDLVSVVLKQIGYKNPLSYYEWVKTNTKCRNTQVIIFTKGKGNGYAMPSSTEMNKELYFVEGAILYEKYLDGQELVPSSIAHEILHIYGAWDLYKTFAQTQERENRARKLFPNSVMLRTSYDSNELEVDEVTAWLIGWNDTPKDWYEWFRPSRTAK
ncbi:hypothetical protein EMA8858_01044 [Emticicia aquatica]|uniref:Uncharacterized protein n=2 Tax=Emticicia aquatica TaxID=1681835 RepID=A0ABN8EPT9_9BACT|nr:hypothetical protein EMA8858_01044 [Emticicia aquatica]